MKEFRCYSNNLQADPKRMRVMISLMLSAAILMCSVFLLLAVMIIVYGQGTSLARISSSIFLVLLVLIGSSSLYSVLFDKMEMTDNEIQCIRHIFFIPFRKVYRIQCIHAIIKWKNIRVGYRYRAYFLYSEIERRIFFPIEVDMESEKYLGKLVVRDDTM